MRRMLLGFSGIVMGVMLAHAGHAQTWLATPGAVGTATLTVGHATVKLPPGDWRELAAAVDAPLQTGGAQSVNIEAKMVAQIVDGRIAAMMYVRSNQTRAAHGWRAPPECARRDVLWFDNASEYDHTYDCLLVNYSHGIRNGATGIWHDASEAAGSFGGIPKPMVFADWNLASGSRLDFITVYLFVNPMLSGLSVSQADEQIDREWKPGALDAARQAYVDKVVAWAKAYRRVVSDAF